MSCTIREVFLDKPPYFKTYVTYDKDTDPRLYVRDVFYEDDFAASVVVVKKPMSLKCERCKKEIRVLDEDDFGEPVWNTFWEQYLCDDCYNKIWDGLLSNACGVCNTEPCKRGRECWVNPFPRIMYLCYVAPRVGAKQ